MKNIDDLIVDRLGEHHRKLDFISKNMEVKKNKHFQLRKISYPLISIAACIAIMIVISPSLFRGNSISSISISDPSFTEFRGDGFEKIVSLIDEENYVEALPLIDEELNKVIVEIESIKSADMSEEEKVYVLALYDVCNEELLWTKIYLLVKLEKEMDLRLCCNNYLKNNSFQAYRAEVKKILKQIR